MGSRVVFLLIYEGFKFDVKTQKGMAVIEAATTAGANIFIAKLFFASPF